MRRRFQRSGSWLDEVSPSQYWSPEAGEVRRELLEETVDGSDYVGDYLKAHHLAGDERILIVGSGNGLDEVRLATDPDFNHQGEIVGLEVPSQDDGFERRFSRATALLQKSRRTNVRFVPGFAQEIPFSDNYFDVVMWPQSGYHFAHHLIRAAKETQRVLRPYGTFSYTTNGEHNKPLHHEVVARIKAKASSRLAHHPMSSPFSLQKSRRVMHYFFRPLISFEQRTQYEISEGERLLKFMNSIGSYRHPEFTYRGDVWMRATNEVMEEMILSRLEAEGIILDDVERGGEIMEHSLRLPALQRQVGRLAFYLN